MIYHSRFPDIKLVVFVIDKTTVCQFKKGQLVNDKDDHTIVDGTKTYEELTGLGVDGIHSSGTGRGGWATEVVALDSARVTIYGGIVHAHGSSTVIVLEKA